MFTSSAEVFRTRQAIGDLQAFALATPDATKLRLVAGWPLGRGASARTARWESLVVRNGCRLPQHGEADGLHGALLLSAALPDDDFPAFLAATAILLADLLQRDDAPDNLYWNWEAFEAHYALGEAPARAAVMNGFRAAHLSGRVTLDAPPEDRFCLTRSADEVGALLSGTGRGDLRDAIAEAIPAETAGALWDRAVLKSLSDAEVAAFRYLAERTEGLAPASPDTAPLVPWRA